MSVKNLLRGGGGIRYAPMIYRGIRNEAYRRFGNPLPEDDVFVVLVGLDFLSRVDVKNLKCPISCWRFWLWLDSENSYQHLPFSARIFWLGCMMTESALIGLRKTLLALDRSIMTT